MNTLTWGSCDPALRVSLFHLTCLLALCWLTYVDVLKGLFVIDDSTSMAVYDGKLQRPLSIGNCWKWLRFHATKVPHPDHQWQEKKYPSYVCSPKAHHRLNIWFLCGTVGMLYSFLARLFGSEVAFLTCVLFTVHPFGTQTVAWISGISYVAGAFLMLTAVNLAYLLTDLGWLTTPLGVLGATVLYGLIHWLAIEVMFAMLGVFLILWFLHLPVFAWVAFGFAIYSGLIAFREAFVLRASTFKEQNMPQTLTLHWRKGIVVLKTLGYYTLFMLWPKRIGIYHTYTYHYELPYAEAEDRYTWIGLVVLIVMGLGWWLGTPLIQFALLWYVAFLILFLNWVTANQFLTERYAWLSTVGACLLLAACAPPWLFWILVGLALMRTWSHLPTYYNETQFYMSNVWNFPNSEIAMGNLGVIYANRGLIGHALETWLLGLSVKSDYDVCWYNIGAALRVRGPLNFNYIPLLTTHIPADVIQNAVKEPVKAHLALAWYCIHRAATSKLSHFRVRWEGELKELDGLLAKTPEELMAMANASTQPLATASSAPVVVTSTPPVGT